MMQIWVDADATPKVVKEILFRAADREKITINFVANQALYLPKSPYLKSLQVASGFDVADNEIVERVEAGDLVITADIPLASDVIDKGANVIDPRGEVYTTENIKGRLNMRDFLDSMRSSGVQTGGPTAYSQSDKQNFANQLDRHIRRGKS